MEIHASILQTILEVFSMQMQNPLGEMVVTYIMVYLVIVALSLLQLLLSILIKPLELSLDFNNSICFFIFL